MSDELLLFVFGGLTFEASTVVASVVSCSVTSAEVVSLSGSVSISFIVLGSVEAACSLIVAFFYVAVVYAYRNCN